MQNCIKCEIPIDLVILGQPGSEYHSETAVAVFEIQDRHELYQLCIQRHSSRFSMR